MSKVKLFLYEVDALQKELFGRAGKTAEGKNVVTQPGILSLKIDGDLRFDLNQIGMKIKPDVKAIGKTQDDLVQELGPKAEGKDKAESIKPGDENWEKFNEELGKVMEKEVELDLPLVKKSLLVKLETEFNYPIIYTKLANAAK